MPPSISAATMRDIDGVPFELGGVPFELGGVPFERGGVLDVEGGAKVGLHARRAVGVGRGLAAERFDAGPFWRVSRASGVFVAVSASHLYGSKGLLAMLRADGYRVTRLRSSPSPGAAMKSPTHAPAR